MPEMIERIQVDYMIKEGENKVTDSLINDRINDIYAISYSIS